MFRSTFFGLELGKRGLLTNRSGTDVIGHNLANSNRPEYSRQTPDIVASNPYTFPGINPVGYGQPGQLGTGTLVQSIYRSQDELLARQIRTVVSRQSRLSVLDDCYAKMEGIFAEPSTEGIDQLLTDFFATWHDLSLAPEESANRTALRETADTLVTEFHQVNQNLVDQRVELNDRLGDLVRKLNDLGTELAQVNNRIMRIKGSGQNPNDLMDTRDDLIMQISELVETKVHIQDDESAIVSIGGRVFVQEDEMRGLSLVANDQNEGYWDLVYADLPTVLVPVATGQIPAITEARDEVIPAFKEKVDALTAGIIEEVNTLHTQGYGLDGLNLRTFFDGTDAETIELSQAIRTNHLAIAAAQTDEAPGDGRNALAIAQLRMALLPDLGDTTFEAYYRGAISDLGATADGVDRSLQGQAQLQTQLETLHESETGVNTDEELVNLIRYEQGYAAASRLITTVDETLDRLINATGRVGL